MHGEELVKKFINEIQLAEDECCIIFDFGCYFPYSNSEILFFDFFIGEKELNDKKINHRYLNKGYQTISKTYGRKVSKLGYPYVMKLSEQEQPMLLCLKVGLQGKFITLMFPIKTSMTKEKPVCNLTLHYLFDEDEMHFMSHYKCKDGGWLSSEWFNHEIEKERMHKGIMILNTPHRASDGSMTVIYDDVIEPHPSSIQDLLIL